MVGGATYTDLFGSLFQLEGMNYTFTGDQTCGETCDSYINVTTTYWRVCFDDYTDTKYENETLFKKVSRSRTLHVNLANVDNVVSTSPRVEVDWMVPARGAGNWRPLENGDCWDRGKVNKIKLVGHKDPTQYVKWSFIIGDEVDIDPVWAGVDSSTDLVACWNLSTDITSVTGGNIGTNYGGAFQTGFIGDGIYLEGNDSGDHFEIPDNASDPFDGLSAFTILVWASPEDVYSAYGISNANVVEIEGAFNFRFEYEWTDQVRSTVNAATAKNTNSANDAVQDSPQWGLYALMWEKDNLSLWFNGTMLVSENNSDTASVTNDVAKIMFFGINDDNSTLQYRGMLDEIAFYSRLLSPAEHLAFYNAEASCTTIATPTVPAKSGLVPTSYSPAYAFYTNGTNPETINLNAGECQSVTWWVNATGTLDTAYEFYAYANMTAGVIINNSAITNTINVTISSTSVDTNFSIWNDSDWIDYTGDTEYLSFRCTPTQTDCEPTNQDVSNSQSIFQICNNGSIRSTVIYMRVNKTLDNVDLKCDDDYSSAGSIVLTTSNQTIHDSLDVDVCINVSCWADFNNPTSGGYLDVFAYGQIVAPDVPPAGIYISNDGSDSYNGTFSYPYKTITKLNTITINPCETVFFNRGDTWHVPTDAFILPDSGNSTCNVTYTSYGNGDNPVIAGSIDGGDSSDYTEDSSNIWVYVDTISEDVGNIIYNDEYVGVKEVTSGALTAQGEFYHNTATDLLYIYSTSNPGTYYTDVQLAYNKPILEIRGDSWTGSDYVYVHNLSFKYGARHGIYVGYTSSNIYLYNNEIAWIGGGAWSSSGNYARWGNGIEVWENAVNIYIRNNTIWEVWDAALTTQGNTAATVTNTEFTGNIVYNATYCFEYFENNAGTTSTNILFNHNTCDNIATFWGMEYRPPLDTANPKCIRYGSQRGTATGVNISENICNIDDISYDATYYWTSMTDWVDWDNDASLYADYNSYYLDDTPVIVHRSTTNYNTLAAFVSAQGKENNSIITETEFEDTSAGDYRPVSGSDACTASSTGSYIGALDCATS